MTIPTRSTISSADVVLCDTARRHGANHRTELHAGDRCGCYFCFRTFPPSAIKAWIDANQTALCPFCGIDAVLGSAQRIDNGFLRKMHQHYFAYRSK